MSDVQYYSAPVNVRQSGVTSANTTIWAMRNPTGTTKTVCIESIELKLAYDLVTPVTPSLQTYDLIRFTTATPTGGSSITVVPMDSTAPATQVTDVRFVDTGLSVTSVVFGTSMITMGIVAAVGACASYSMKPIIILNAGEGLCIRINTASILGQNIFGSIKWSER